MMDGMRIQLTPAEAAAVDAALAEGADEIVVRGARLNRKCYSGLYPDDLVRAVSDAGRLHDGTRVIRRFGEWRDADTPDVRLSPAHYPEIARDEVMTEDEWRRRPAALPPGP